MGWEEFNNWEAKDEAWYDALPPLVRAGEDAEAVIERIVEAWTSMYESVEDALRPLEEDGARIENVRFVREVKEEGSATKYEPINLGDILRRVSQRLVEQFPNWRGSWRGLIVLRGCFVPAYPWLGMRRTELRWRSVGVRFGDSIGFYGVNFDDFASFAGATFGHGASFAGARFGHGARFDRATFGGGADFDGTTFGHEARFDGALFRGDASFLGARFGPGGGIGGTRVARRGPLPWWTKVWQMNWAHVRAIGNLKALTRASYLSLVIVPLLAGAWAGLAQWLKLVPPTGVQPPKFALGWAVAFFAALSAVLGHLVYQIAVPRPVRAGIPEKLIRARREEFLKAEERVKSDQLDRAFDALAKAAKVRPWDRHPTLVKRFDEAVWLPHNRDVWNRLGKWEEERAAEAKKAAGGAGATAQRAGDGEGGTPGVALTPAAASGTTAVDADRRPRFSRDELGPIIIEEGAKAEFDVAARGRFFWAGAATLLYLWAGFFVLWLTVQQSAAVIDAVRGAGSSSARRVDGFIWPWGVLVMAWLTAALAILGALSWVAYGDWRASLSGWMDSWLTRVVSRLVDRLVRAADGERKG